MEIKKTETPCAGFHIDYYDNGIIRYRAENLTRTVIDNWAKFHVQHEKEAVTEKRHLQRVMDMRLAGLPTPYSTTRTMQVIKESQPELKESLAILVRDGAMFQLVRSIVNRIPNAQTAGIRIFTQEEIAFMWLEKRLLE